MEVRSFLAFKEFPKDIIWKILFLIFSTCNFSAISAYLDTDRTSLTRIPHKWYCVHDHLLIGQLSFDLILLPPLQGSKEIQVEKMRSL
jgi:hypothetical protein